MARASEDVEGGSDTPRGFSVSDACYGRAWRSGQDVVDRLLTRAAPFPVRDVARVPPSAVTCIDNRQSAIDNLRRGTRMALDDLKQGMTATQAVVCGPEHFASGIVAGTPDVFSTPALGALVEKTAAEWIGEHIGADQMTVGAQIVINHTAATPEGMTVTAVVTLVTVDGRRLDFTWTASDSVDEVGTGTHQRFVVDRARFEQRLSAKRGQ